MKVSNLNSRNLEFRVKSVSASTFTPEEIKALQEGGNEIGRRVWLSSYSPSDFATPGLEDTLRILDFMRQKYQSKRWYSEEQRQRQQALAQQAQLQTGISQLEQKDYLVCTWQLHLQLKHMMRLKLQDLIRLMRLYIIWLFLVECLL